MVTMPDHVVLGSGFEKYPYGAFPAGAALPYPEPLTTLAAVASVTSRITLHTSTLIVPLRPAPLLAKACATVDVLSGGRLVLGAGAGWHEDEFNASGVPFAGRGDRMDDTLRACKALWRDAPASVSSPTVSFDGLHCEPRPVRPCGIPVWVGGSSIAPDRTAGRRVRRRLDPSALADAGADRRRGGANPERAAGRALEVSYALPIVDGDLDRSLDMCLPCATQG